MRLVSLAASNTEWVWALGLSEWLVGVDNFSDFPSLPTARRLGPDLDVDIAGVVALSPDLVLASNSVPGMERVVAQLEQAGLPHLILDPVSLDDVFDDARLLGRELGVASRGEELADRMERAIEELGRRMLRGHRHLEVMVEWWPRPVIAAGRLSWVTGLLERLGAKNAFSHLEVRSMPLTSEIVERTSPEAIVLSWCGAKRSRLELVDKRGWTVPAVRMHRIMAVSEAYLGRPGPRLVEGAIRIAESLSAWMR